MNERIIYVALKDLPLEQRLQAVERILADDPHTPQRERNRLYAIARDPRNRGGRIIEAR